MYIHIIIHIYVYRSIYTYPHSLKFLVNPFLMVYHQIISWIIMVDPAFFCGIP